MVCTTKGKKIRSKEAGISGRGYGYGNGEGPLGRGLVGRKPRIYKKMEATVAPEILKLEDE